MAKKKSGNPKNRSGGGRVTAADPIPKHIRKAIAIYKSRGGTLAELQAIDKALDKRLGEIT